MKQSAVCTAAVMVSPRPETLRLTTKLAFGAGDLGPAITANVLVFFLLFFFTNVAGLPAGLAGSILAIGKVADAINDPIAGILSDRTRTRWGRRLPWIFAGAVPFGILYALQWVVPRFSDDPAANHWGLFVYYLAIAVLFNLAYTVVNLPYTALTPELTQDYNERTSLNSFRFAFSIGGSILSLVLATAIVRAYPSEPETQYWVLGWVSSTISVIALFWCACCLQERGAEPLLPVRQRQVWGSIVAIAGGLAVISAPVAITLTQRNLWGILAILLGLLLLGFGLSLRSARAEPHLTEAARFPEASLQPALSLRQQLRIAFQNRPFLYVIGIYLCSWLAVQLTASILIYFVVSWMGLTEETFPLVAIAVQGTALAMLFVWQPLSDRLGKKAVYFLGSGIWIVAQAGLFLLQPGQVSWMYFLAVLAGMGVSVAYLIPWSMIPDVTELDELRTGQRREGIFYAFMVLLQKMGLALALFLVGIVLEAAGFVEQLPGEPIPFQPESALLAIRFAVGPLPTVILLGGLVLAYFYPITKDVHAEIRLKLAEKRQSLD